MREIEFRGKRSARNEWAYGFYVEDDCNQAFVQTVCIGIKPGKNFLPVDPETAGQYTGLKDRNGVKIFEGDILSARILFNSDERFYLPVAYQGARFVLQTKSGYSVSLDEYYHDAEIAGSIHDNPELLNGEGGKIK